MTDDEKTGLINDTINLAKRLLTAAVDFGYHRVVVLLGRDDPARYTYYAGLGGDGDRRYAAGEGGELTWEAPAEVRIVDLLAFAKELGAFVVDSVTADGAELLSGYCVPAVVFGPAVQDRGVRSDPLPKGAQVKLKFRNQCGGDEPLAFHAAMRVTSQDPPPRAVAP